MYFSSPFTQCIFTPIQALGWLAVQRQSWHGLCPHEGYTWVWKLPAIIHHSITIFWSLYHHHISQGKIFFHCLPPSSSPTIHMTCGWFILTLSHISTILSVLSVLWPTLLRALSFWNAYLNGYATMDHSHHHHHHLISKLCAILYLLGFTQLFHMCVASAEAKIKTRVILTLKFIPFNGAVNTLQVAQW